MAFFPATLCNSFFSILKSIHSSSQAFYDLSFSLSLSLSRSLSLILTHKFIFCQLEHVYLIENILLKDVWLWTLLMGVYFRQSCKSIFVKILIMFDLEYKINKPERKGFVWSNCWPLIFSSQKRKYSVLFQGISICSDG